MLVYFKHLKSLQHTEAVPDNQKISCKQSITLAAKDS